MRAEPSLRRGQHKINDRSPIAALIWLVAPVPRADAVISLAIVLIVAGAGVAVGYQAFSPEADASGPGGLLETTEFWPVLQAILSQNLAAALLAFSGVATAGLSTLFGISLTSLWVGASFHAVQVELGAAEVVIRVLPYAGIEFAGILLAATAGLLPAVVFVAERFRYAPRQRYTYTSSVPGTLRLFLVAVLLITMGALVEAAVIATAHP
ncbi:stage II sporulation protein M [Cryobacterium sp. Y57]|uniref:stage II sporulation protein M n=1 Tax=Cryobacterium sp. Y57 TaxID=2048287 RepID=UPI000CE2E3E3